MSPRMIRRDEDKDGHKVSSGIYIYPLKTSNKTLSRKMVFIK